MAEKDFGDFFIGDLDEDLAEDDEDIVPPAVVPAPSAATPSSDTGAATAPPPAAPPVVPEVRPAAAQPAEAASAPDSEASAAPAPVWVPEVSAVPPAPPVAGVSGAVSTREERLGQALNDLMVENVDIQAVALVSLDGFTMASALPEGMHEDRVGAMSAAILGLGERAAAELGRGGLSQVFIEGDGGYVVLIAAGPRAVLTALADAQAKLGLVLYDMRDAAGAIGEILG